MDSSKVKKIYIDVFCSVYKVNKSWNIAIPAFLCLLGVHNTLHYHSRLYKHLVMHGFELPRLRLELSLTIDLK